MRDELRFRATTPRETAPPMRFLISNGRKRELLSDASDDVRLYETSVPYDDSPEAFDMYVVHVALDEIEKIPDDIVTHFNKYMIPKCTVSQKQEYNRLLTEEVNELYEIISDLNVTEHERRSRAAAAVRASLPRKVLPGLSPFQMFPHPPGPSLVDRVAYNMSNQPHAGVFAYDTGDHEEHARVDLIRSILCHMLKHATNPKKGWRREFDRLYKAHGILFRVVGQPQNWYVANMQIDRAELLRRAPNPPITGGGGGGGVAAVNPNAANMNAWLRLRGIRKHRRIEPPRGPSGHGGGHMTAMRRAKLLCNSTPFGQFVKFLEHLLRENAYRIEERYYVLHPPTWPVGPNGPGPIPEYGDLLGRPVTAESNIHGAECRRLRTAADNLHQTWKNLLNCMCVNAVLFKDNDPGIGTTMTEKIDNTHSTIVARFPAAANQSAGGYRRRAYTFNPVVQDPDNTKSCCIILRDHLPVAAAAGARWLHLRRGNSGAPGCGPPSLGQGVYEALMEMVMEILVKEQSISPDGLVVQMNSAGAMSVPPELIDRNVAYEHTIGDVVAGAGGEQNFTVYRTGGSIDDWAGGGTLSEQVRFYWRNAY